MPKIERHGPGAEPTELECKDCRSQYTVTAIERLCGQTRCPVCMGYPKLRKEHAWVDAWLKTLPARVGSTASFEDVIASMEAFMLDPKWTLTGAPTRLGLLYELADRGIEVLPQSRRVGLTLHAAPPVVMKKPDWLAFKEAKERAKDEALAEGGVR